MIGQVVELEGEFQRYYCEGWKGSVLISPSRLPGKPISAL